MASGIYKIEHIPTSRCYIGSAVSLGSRLSRHKTELNTHRHCNLRLQRAWDKHGAAEFSFSVLEIVKQREDLISREQHWLDHLKSSISGFNICPTAGSILGSKKSAESVARTAAAHRGMKRSEETRAKIREARARQVFSESTRAKLAARGKNWRPTKEMLAKALAANLGKKASPEAIEKNRLKQLGKKLSPETITKMIATRAGFRHSDASRKKMSAWQIGRKMSPEAIAKSVAARAGYHTSTETRSKISLAIKGKPKPLGFGDKIRAALVGRSHSLERIAKRIATRKQNNELRMVAGEAFQA